MQVNIYNTVDEVISKMAEYFVVLANEKTRRNQRFSVALSGGNSPKRLFELLVSEHYRNQVDWNKIDFFFGDERYVPHSDNASNYKMANEVLLQPLSISPAQIFPVNTSLPPADAAEDYWNIIKRYFKDASPSFDLILLGIGDNSHTASLFPHTSILHETTATVRTVYVKELKAYRISFSAPLINLAHNIAFLVYGSEKAMAVYNILKAGKDIEQFPAQLIQTARGEINWFVDKAAASEIRKS